MSRCIYCLIDKPRSEFNREHVLPEAFGRFRNAPVLHEAVCEHCNSYFGSTLDLVLSRSSSEGLERYGWQVKPADDIVHFRYGDVLIRLLAPGSALDGALVRKIPGPIPGETRIELIPQAVFESIDGSGPIHIPEWNIRSGQWKRDKRLDVTKEIRILAVAEEYDSVKTALQEQGIFFEHEREIDEPQPNPGEQFGVHHEFRFSRELQRAVAKLAFNYFVFKSGPEVALHRNFDGIRAFIRFDSEPSFRPVTLLDKLLSEEREKTRVPVVHCLTFQRHASGAGIAHVTLFNWAVYQIMLSPTLPESLTGASSGHLYNVAELDCYPMVLVGYSQNLGKAPPAH
jgi:hypothetical protein